MAVHLNIAIQRPNKHKKGVLFRTYLLISGAENKYKNNFFWEISDKVTKRCFSQVVCVCVRDKKPVYLLQLGTSLELPLKQTKLN